MQVASKGGSKYFVVFIDDYLRWCEVAFISKKSEVLNVFKKFKAEVENSTGKKIKCLQSDNGTEFVNRESDQFMHINGIKRRLTVPHTPQQNGVAERKNRTLVETTRCMMLQSQLSPSFWAEALSTANYIRNRCPSRALEGETPFKYWTGKRPNLSNCRPFGVAAYALDKNPQKPKFESRSKKCIFLGYSEKSKAYRLWSNANNKFIKSREVFWITFIKIIKFLWTLLSKSPQVQ